MRCLWFELLGGSSLSDEPEECSLRTRDTKRDTIGILIFPEMSCSRPENFRTHTSLYEVMQQFDILFACGTEVRKFVQMSTSMHTYAVETPRRACYRLAVLHSFLFYDQGNHLDKRVE